MSAEGGSRGAALEIAAVLVITVVSLAGPAVTEWIWGVAVERSRVVFLGW